MYFYNYFFFTECAKGTNKVCTSFKYENVEYHDCEWSYLYLGYWCLLPGQTGINGDWSYCGECAGDTENKNADDISQAVTLQGDVKNDVITSKMQYDDEGSASGDDVIFSDDECDCDDDIKTTTDETVTFNDVTTATSSDEVSKNFDEVTSYPYKDMTSSAAITKNQEEKLKTYASAIKIQGIIGISSTAGTLTTQKLRPTELLDSVAFKSSSKQNTTDYTVHTKPQRAGDHITSTTTNSTENNFENTEVETTTNIETKKHTINKTKSLKSISSTSTVPIKTTQASTTKSLIKAGSRAATSNELKTADVSSTEKLVDKTKILLTETIPLTTKNLNRNTESDTMFIKTIKVKTTASTTKPLLKISSKATTYFKSTSKEPTNSRSTVNTVGNIEAIKNTSGDLKTYGTTTTNDVTITTDDVTTITDDEEINTYDVKTTTSSYDKLIKSNAHNRDDVTISDNLAFDDVTITKSNNKNLTSDMTAYPYKDVTKLSSDTRKDTKFDSKIDSLLDKSRSYSTLQSTASNQNFTTSRFATQSQTIKSEYMINLISKYIPQ